MQYHHRSLLPPPFGRGGGAGYPRGHRQLYAPPPPAPLPAPPPPPQRRYEVLMEAGRLAAEYLVSKGVLPPSSLQRGSGGGAWAAPPPRPPQQQQESPAFYGRRRYEDEYSNNPSTRSRRNSSTSSSSRDDYSSGGIYNGRGKRKYGEYRRGYSDGGRERERGRSSLNGRRYEEDKDEDGAPGFRRVRRGNGGDDEARSCVTEGLREATPLMVKVVGELEMEDTRSKALSSSGDVWKGADGPPEVQGENEEGEMAEDSKVLSSELEVVEQGIDPNGDGNNSSIGAVMEAEAKLLPDVKVLDEKAEDDDKVLGEAALDRIALSDEATNLEYDLHDDRRNLLKYFDFAKAPTRPRSVRACRNAASIQRETVDLVSSGEASQMVVDETAIEGSLPDIQSDNREDQIYQENTGSSIACNEIMEPMLLQENKTAVVTENIREEKNDAQLHVVQKYKEETDVSRLMASKKDRLMQETDLSLLTASLKDGLMQETNLSPLTDSHKDSLVEETNLSPLTDSHKDSLIEETNLSLLTASHKEADLSPLTASHNDSLMQETDLSRTMSSHEDSLKLQFKEGTQICDIGMLPQHLDLIEYQRKIIGAELFPNVEVEPIIKMEQEKLDLSPLTASHEDSYSHNDSLIKEANLSPLTASHNDSLMQETDLSQTMSSHEDSLKLQFKEGTQICDIGMLPQHLDLIEYQRKIIGAELFPNVEVEPIIKMEQEKLDQSSSFKICDLDLVGGTKVSTMHNNPELAQCSAEGSSAEPQKQQQEDFGTSAGGNVSGTDDFCQLPLDNKDVQVIDIEDDAPIEVGDFDSSKAKNEMMCSSMDNAMHPGVHTGDLPGIQDGYNLAISDYLGADRPCYPSMQSDLQAGICANDSEGIPVMDDPIYGSLTDIGFMDVWGQPAPDYEKFF